MPRLVRRRAERDRLRSLRGRPARRLPRLGVGRAGGASSARADGESRGHAAASGTRAASQLLLDRPEATILAVTHRRPDPRTSSTPADGLGADARASRRRARRAVVLDGRAGRRAAGSADSAGLAAPPSLRPVGTMQALLDRVEASIRAHDLIPPGGEVTCLVSGGADSTCLWHALGELGYRVSAVHVHHGLRGAEADADARHAASCSAPRSIAAPAARDRGGAARHSATRADRGPRPPRDRPHGLRPGRDRPLRPRRERLHPADQGAARGRRRAAAAHGLARGDGGVLPRARPAVPHRHDEPRTRSAASSATRSCRCSSGSTPRADASLLALADERPRLPRALERTLAELLARPAGTSAPTSAAASGRCASTARSGSRASVELGPVAARRATGRTSRFAAAVRGIASQAAARRCRICSWTPRCRGRSATAGRSSCAATRSWPCRASPRRRAGKVRCERRGGAVSERMTAEANSRRASARS